VTPLPELVERFRGKKIAVVGDIIADVYVYGMPYKLSREAPVVVIKYEEEAVIPGSAGNTIHNLLALGAHVFPLGFIGKDEAGEKLREVFSAFKNVEMDCLVSCEGRTVTKTRILAGDTHTSKHQVIRIDRTNDKPVSEKARKELKGRLTEISDVIDGLILSDYEYGTVDSDIISHARALAAEKVVVGDSWHNLRAFGGFTLITPNESEAYALAGMDGKRDIEEVGREIVDSLGVKGALVTRGNRGMNLFLNDGSAHHIPISGSNEVTDVTGAGDTVAAAVTLSLASGIDFYTSSRIANYAAGIVVMKRGTAVVTVEELIKAITKWENTSR
jgi:D-glycero-beta-D-manno-heptose-7-phosphate kinase